MISQEDIDGVASPPVEENKSPFDVALGKLDAALARVEELEHRVRVLENFQSRVDPLWHGRRVWNIVGKTMG
jgi:hypothetical protein